MATTIGNEYEHIDFTHNNITTRHPIKDATARSMIGDIVKISDSDPQLVNNKIWIKETPNAEVQVPTYEEFEEVKAYAYRNKNLIDPAKASSGVSDYIPIDSETRYVLTHKDRGSGNFSFTLYTYDANKANMQMSFIELTAGEYEKFLTFNTGRAYLKITVSSAPDSIDRTDISRVYLGKFSDGQSFVPYHYSVDEQIDNRGYYTKPVSGIPGSDIASGVIPVLTDLIDDTAGVGDSTKVWSADKSATEHNSLLSAISQERLHVTETDKYINLSGNTADVFNPSTSVTGSAYTLERCDAGDEFIVNATGGSSPRAWGFVSETGTVLSVAAASITVSNLHLTAPEDSYWLVINDNSGSTSYRLHDVTTVIDDLRGSDDALQDEINFIKEDILDVQETPVSPKNLNATPYDQSHTESGVTFTTNVDNSVDLSGTASGNIWWPIATNASYRWLLPAGTYTLSGGISATINADLMLYANKSDSTPVETYACGPNDGTPVTFTTEADYWAIVRFSVYKNAEVTGLVFKPQIETGNTATEYESPWRTIIIQSALDDIKADINNIKAANNAEAGKVLMAKTVSSGTVTSWEFDELPEVSIDDTLTNPGEAADAKATGDRFDTLENAVQVEIVQVPSKNLNATPYDASKTSAGVTFTTNEDNSISMSGTSTGYVWWPDATKKAYRFLLPAGTYTLSGGLTATMAVNLRLYNSDTSTTLVDEYSCGADDGVPVTFTTEEDLWGMVRVVIAPNAVTTNKVLKPQIESGTSATEYVSPWPTETLVSRFDPIESDVEELQTDASTAQDGISALESRVNLLESGVLSSDTRKFNRTGKLIQYTPAAGTTPVLRIDFSSTDGFEAIRFTHCGENLVDLAGVVRDGYSATVNGVTATISGGVIHATGTNTSKNWSNIITGYMSSKNYWLPEGKYVLSKGYGMGTMNLDETVGNVNSLIVKEQSWQAVQWYFAVRGGHTVEDYYPAMLVAGDKMATSYKAFTGEHVSIALPTVVYGGWIDINNAVLHVTQTLSNGTLVDVTETTYNLDPIILTNIAGMNTLYSIDGKVGASGFEPVQAKQTFEMPVPDWYLNNGYLEGKADRVKQLARTVAGNGDVFFWITDVHVENNRCFSISLIRELYRKCGIPKLFCGGDIADGYGYWMQYFVDELKTNYPGAIHWTIGNHEYMETGENLLAQVFDFGKDEQVGNPGRHYYYVDNPQQKLRYIVLSSCKSDNNTWSWGYEQSQLDWLENTALNVQAGWGIILFTHITFQINWDTGEKGDVPAQTQAVFDILDNYNGNGEIIALIAGHMHLDAIDHTEGGIPIIFTTCDKAQPYVEGSTPDFDSSIRDINTITEQAFDVVALNRSSKTITFVRIGCPAWNLVDGVIDTEEPYVEEREVSYDRS